MSLKLLILLQLCNVIFVSGTVSKTCPPGTIASGTNAELCYKFIKTPDTFDKAEASCQKENGHLVQLRDKQTNIFVSDLAKKNLFQIFWTGGEDVQIGNNYVWTWTDDSFLKYFNWIAASEGYHSDKNCLSVHSEDASWSSANCSTTLPYICQIPRKISVCESGWTYFDISSKCYKAFARNYTTAVDAEKECVGFGGHLASIYNEEENAMLVELLTTLAIGNWSEVGVWIGGVSDGNNTWSWTDGTPFVFKNWRPTDPNVVTGKAYTIFFPDEQLYNGIRGTWDDAVAANKVKRFVCQKNPTLV